ncbi:MAG: tol-pal system YbgF family protein [Candidatus Methylacidiphilaceae bacterium]
MPKERLSFPPIEQWSRGSLLPLAALLLLLGVFAAGIGIYAWQSHARRLLWEKVASAYAKTSTSSERLALIERHRDVPQSALWLLQTAATQFQEHSYAEATKSFQLFLDYFPKHPLRPAALLGTGAGWEAQGKREEAVRSYREILGGQATDPYRLLAEINLARLEIEQKEYAPARALLETIHRRKPVNRFEGEVQDLHDRLPP